LTRKTRAAGVLADDLKDDGCSGMNALFFHVGLS
jgi:hypothetical protein